MGPLMTIEGYDGERVLVSYDVSGSARGVAARVCQIVFGRKRISEGRDRTPYREKGFIHRPGVVWIGQSVLVMPPATRSSLPACCIDSACEWPPGRFRLIEQASRRSAARSGLP